MTSDVSWLALPRNERSRALIRGVMTTTTAIKHGLFGWDHGCRCEVCKRAQAARQKRYREANPDRDQTTGQRFERCPACGQRLR